ncbi:MAG: PH domain-containing protein [Myxococcota bacterium]|nr:PH domain-containing protein [Myxococcota bacterium]
MAPAPPDQQLDSSTITLWRLQRLVRLALFNLPVAVALGGGASTLLGLPAGVAVGGGLVSLSLLMLVAWPPLEYRHWRYAVRDHDLLVQHGVLFRRWSSIPLNRIQHVDTRQGPMERMLGLSRLLVYTASGVSADGSIPGLTQAVAEQLRDELSRRGGDDGV